MFQIKVDTSNFDNFDDVMDDIQNALRNTAQDVLNKSVDDEVIPYLSGDLQNQIITNGASEIENNGGEYSCYINAIGPHVARLWFGYDNRAPRYVIGNDKGYTQTHNKNAGGRWWDYYDDYAYERMIENLKGRK